MRFGGPKCIIVPNFVQICQRYGRFRFFKMVAVRHLGILKVGNFNCAYCPFEGQNASSYRILCRSVKQLRRYGLLQFSRWPPSSILDFKKFKILTAHALRRAKMHHYANFLQICQGVAEIWPFSIFQDGGRPQSWICYTRVWTTQEV